MFSSLDKADFNEDLDLSTYDEIIICPSNPYVSINPMLQLLKLKNYLCDYPHKVTTISPIVNAQSLKGPTAKMMQELGKEVSVKTIAKFYKNYSKRIFIDSSDESESNELSDLGYEVYIADLIMSSLDKKMHLPRESLMSLNQNK